MTRPARWPSVLLALSGWVALLVTSTPAGSMPRVTVTLAFLLMCPGTALLALARPLLGPRQHSGDAMESVALAFALSIGTAMLVSTVYFMTGTFTLARAVTTLAVITSAAAIGALFVPRRV
jgi:uncharacterized membrane protein